GVNIRRNVSRIKRLKALSPSKIIPVLRGQYAPDYPAHYERKQNSKLCGFFWCYVL
ncbi:MAG: hypothetical protein HLUCCX10_03250, partial [Algoriphagus marincola HL-49]